VEGRTEKGKQTTVHKQMKKPSTTIAVHPVNPGHPLNNGCSSQVYQDIGPTPPTTILDLGGRLESTRGFTKEAGAGSGFYCPQVLSHAQHKGEQELQNSRWEKLGCGHPHEAILFRRLLFPLP